MASELFAHLNTMVIDPEVRKIYETLMPESVKVFDDIIKEVGTKQLIKAAKSATKSK